MHGVMDSAMTSVLSAVGYSQNGGISREAAYAMRCGLKHNDTNACVPYTITEFTYEPIVVPHDKWTLPLHCICNIYALNENKNLVILHIYMRKYMYIHVYQNIS